MIAKQIVWTCVLMVMLVAKVWSQTDAGTDSVQKLIVVQGAGGTAEYEKSFSEWAQRWQQLATPESNIDLTYIYKSEKSQPLEQLEQAIGESKKAEAIWIVLIGHGTDDRKTSKFNLVGPDVSATQLGTWLKPLSQPVVLINCASSSGSFIPKLKSKLPANADRIVVTATKSGAQYNFARFGEHLSQAISDSKLDLDKDDQTSLLEAFISASFQTQDFYEREKRLATELALLDDNQDGLGTPGNWFSGTRVVKQTTKGEPDGARAARMVLVRRGDEAKLSVAKRKARDEIEQQIESLRKRKKLLPEDEYFQQLQTLMVKLALLYEPD